MPIEVTPYNPIWPTHFAQIATAIRPAIAHIPSAQIEHVGSTSVPGLAAKPILDSDIIVDPHDIPTGVAALESIGYLHRGDLGVPGREAFSNPDGPPTHHLDLCERGCLSVPNHLAVRDVLRRPDLRDAYADVKLALASDPAMDIDPYIDGKSAILQKILAESGLTPDELQVILGINALTFPR